MIRRMLGASIAMLALAASATFSSAFAADAYTFDKSHSRIVFTWNHLGMSNQSARFASFDGDIVFDAEKAENSKVSVTIDPASVVSDWKQLDEHFKGEDFFNVAKFPKATFVSTDVRKTGKNAYQITGNLTIKGKTMPVVLDSTLNYSGDHPLAGYVKALAGANYLGWSAKTRIRRTDFDLGLYAPMTSDTIDITIESEMRQKK
jgi:polyisoprenoid-binding protein YceI